jgi:Fe-S-cluster-containing hydrogenase component 2
MSKLLTISPEKCINCGTCEAVCPNAAVNVIHFDEVEISVPVMCLQCEDAACMEVCPVGAIFRDENGAVVTDPEKCVGCKMCISACLLGNISYNAVEQKIVKCNLCGGDPRCAKYCPKYAIEYLDADLVIINKKKAIAGKFKELFADV